jgi:hypothetical protein
MVQKDVIPFYGPAVHPAVTSLIKPIIPDSVWEIGGSTHPLEFFKGFSALLPTIEDQKTTEFVPTIWHLFGFAIGEAIRTTEFVVETTGVLVTTSVTLVETVTILFESPIRLPIAIGICFLFLALA